MTAPDCDYDEAERLYAELERLPLPPDAVRVVSDWDWYEDDDTMRRGFDVRTWTEADAAVSVGALQFGDGHVDDWEISISGADWAVTTADQARRLSAVLLEAADELDRRQREASGH